MTNVTLSIDDQLLSQSRSYAASHGTSLNGLIRQLLVKEVSKQQGEDWFGRFLLVSEQAQGSLNGWKFNREELYDDRVS
jgi:hypothetical protein